MYLLELLLSYKIDRVHLCRDAHCVTETLFLPILYTQRIVCGRKNLSVPVFLFSPRMLHYCERARRELTENTDLREGTLRRRRVTYISRAYNREQRGKKKKRPLFCISYENPLGATFSQNFRDFRRAAKKKA